MPPLWAEPVCGLWLRVEGQAITSPWIERSTVNEQLTDISVEAGSWRKKDHARASGDGH